MKQIAQPAITSCTVTWDDCGLGCADDIRRVVTRILQTEIQVRFYNGYGDLISGRIWPVSNQQKTEIFDCLNKSIQEWGNDDYSVEVCDGYCWEMKLCAKGKCLRLIKGTVEPLLPHNLHLPGRVRIQFAPQRFALFVMLNISSIQALFQLLGNATGKNCCQHIFYMHEILCGNLLIILLS